MLSASDVRLVAERDAKLAALGPRPPRWHPFARRRWKLAHARISAMDVSWFAAMTRQYYPSEMVIESAERSHPLLACLRKAPRR